MRQRAKSTKPTRYSDTWVLEILHSQFTIQKLLLAITMSRWTKFFIAILIGIGLGLFYGLVLDPVDYVDTTPNSLRQDYQADYVLMVAEAYQAERDPAVADARLAFLGVADVRELVYNTYLFAVEVGYSENDQAKLDELYDALMDWSASQPETTP